MKFSVNRETLLPPLLAVGNVVERRQTLPILGNVLINLEPDQATLIATDMEVEALASVPLDSGMSGSATLPARKLIDICRALPADAEIRVNVDDKQAVVTSGRSRFTLAILPATEFPNIGEFEAAFALEVDAGALRALIADTQFAMAQQDVRYYLNGLLLEFEQDTLRAVATDGHRLALAVLEIEGGPAERHQVIVPRKGVAELARLLDGGDGAVTVQVSENHLQAALGGRRLTTKLIDGKFPDYERVIPGAATRVVAANREALRQGLARASILSNEKFRGVRLSLQPGVLKALAHNPDQEEAEEEIAVEYDGDEIEIGFNVSYLLDVLSTLRSEEVRVELTDANSSCLIRASESDPHKYVVMPMRL